jgi:hypothetical protein
MRAELAKEKAECERNRMTLLRLKEQLGELEMKNARAATECEKKTVEVVTLRAESLHYQTLLCLLRESSAQEAERHQSERRLLEANMEKMAHQLKQIEEEEKKKEDVRKRQEKRRKQRGMARMLKQYGWEIAAKKGPGWAAVLTGRADRKDSDLLDAAMGFWLGSQKEGISGKEGRAGKQFRKDLLFDLAKFGNEGNLWLEIQNEVMRGARADPAVIAKAQDTDSAFNPRALQGMRKCLPGYKKGKHGLVLPSQSCVNGPKEIVRAVAERFFGSIFDDENDGKLWRWDFKKGVHTYLKRKYYDVKSDDVSEENPWLVLVTGDAAKVSGRNAIATICGLKICDARHPEQNRTGKCMNQSPSMYTPAICSVLGDDHQP